MKPIGNIRRVDDLGRVVIPRDIRSALKIKDGDAIEIFEQDDFVCFAKYNPDYGNRLNIATDILEEKILSVKMPEEKNKEVSEKLAQLRLLSEYFSDFANTANKDNVSNQTASNDDFQVKVCFQNCDFYFDSGAKAYILHTGIYNDFHINYSMDELLKYVSFVYECYIADDNRTPLASLADYISENWETVKTKGRRAVLNEFYS